MVHARDVNLQSETNIQTYMMKRTIKRFISSVGRCNMQIACLFVVLGMLSACQDAMVEDSNLLPSGFDGEYIHESQIIGSWNVDLDGAKEINAGRMGIVLSKKGASYFTCDAVDYENDTLYNVKTPIDSWKIEYADDEKEDEYKGTVLKMVTNGKDLHWHVESARQDSIVCSLYNEEMEASTRMVMYRDGSVYDHAPEIKLEPEEVADFCAQLRQIADSTSDFPVATAGTPTSRWMSDVSDDVKVCNVAIPGTHDSGTAGITRYGRFAAQTQEYTLKEQFDKGVRSFDLRVRNSDGKAKIFHNFISCELSFRDAMLDIMRSVAKTSECAFVIVKTEGNDMSGKNFLKGLGTYLTAGGVKMDTEKLDEMATRKMIYNDILAVEEQVKREMGIDASERIIADYRPDVTMGESRGKLFIINRLDKDTPIKCYPFVGQGAIGSFGGTMDLVTLKPESQRKGTAEDTIVYKKAMIINDLYADDPQISHHQFYQMKSSQFHELFMYAHHQRVDGTDENILYFNSASASIGDWVAGHYTPIPDYASVCENVYPTLIKYMQTERTCGLIPMDYAGMEKYRRLTTGEIIGIAATDVWITVLTPGLQQGLLLAMYRLALLLKSPYSVHGDGLLNAIINQSRIPAKLDSISLNKYVSNIEVGKEDTLRVIFHPADATDRDIEGWTTSNPEVVSLTDNKVMGLKQGNARVTVKLKNGMQASAYVVVGAKKMRAVSLGLSVDWADRNIGAAAPECDGYFYTWGDTDLRLRNYVASGYKFGAASDKYYRYSKANPEYVLVADDDPAAQLGGGWRMPTTAEVEELIAKAEWKLEVKNGVKGYTVSHNGNSIFLPVTGYFNGYDLHGREENEGYFWTRSIYKSSQWQWDFGNAIYIHYDEKLPFHGTSNMLRYQGLPIRPVRAKSNSVENMVKGRKKVKK